MSITQLDRQPNFSEKRYFPYFWQKGPKMTCYFWEESFQMKDLKWFKNYGLKKLGLKQTKRDPK